MTAVERVRRWRLTHREKRNQTARQRYAADKCARRRYAKAWIAMNKGKARAYAAKWQKKARKADLKFRLRENLSRRIRHALTGVKSAKTLELLGCSVEAFRGYLEAHFKPGMTWGNYGSGLDRWNIDHKVPCATFDLTDPGQQRRCFHYSNLQPLWELDNKRKGAQPQRAAEQ